MHRFGLDSGMFGRLEMKFGCHISISRGFEKAAKTAYDLGARSFQVFTKNPRSLRQKKLDLEDAERGVSFCKQHGLTLVAHTPYITNLSTPKEDLHQLTIRSIREDLQIASAYGAVGAVVHCGKHVGQGEEKGKKKMIETLNRILDDYHGSAKLLLENTAGQGSEIGLTIEELVEIREATEGKEYIGFCFDTCHGFAAGIWSDSTFDELVATMEQSGYLKHLVAVHFNDSKAEFHSRKDRHEKIGEGKIGFKALARFLHSPAFEGLPFILETPVQKEAEYADEIRLLQRLKEGKNS